MQYALFELKAVKVQAKIVSKQTGAQTKNFTKHCGMLGVCVPTKKMFSKVTDA